MVKSQNQIQVLKQTVNYLLIMPVFNGSAPATTVDFTPAANAASPAVVHIKTKTNAKQIQQNRQPRQRNPFFDFLVTRKC